MAQKSRKSDPVLLSPPQAKPVKYGWIWILLFLFGVLGAVWKLSLETPEGAARQVQSIEQRQQEVKAAIPMPQQQQKGPSKVK